MRASVVIRTLDSAATLGACLASVRRQSVRTEVVVVDSGSTDATLAICEEQADTVVRIPRASFTYGRALNRGFEAATGDVVLCLSSHCELVDDGHVARALAWHEDPHVAATTGIPAGPDGRVLRAPLRVDRWPAGRRPWWGFSNHANSVSAAAWRLAPFDEQLPACEDKAWARAVHAAGFAVVYDPSLVVTSHHRKRQGFARLHARAVREGAALQTLLPGADLSAGLLVRERWLRMQGPSPLPYPVRVVDPYKVVEVAGLWRGARAARRGTAARPDGSAP